MPTPKSKSGSGLAGGMPQRCCSGHGHLPFATEALVWGIPGPQYRLGKYSCTDECERVESLTVLPWPVLAPRDRPTPHSSVECPSRSAPANIGWLFFDQPPPTFACFRCPLPPHEDASLRGDAAPVTFVRSFCNIPSPREDSLPCNPAAPRAARHGLRALTSPIICVLSISSVCASPGRRVQNAHISLTTKHSGMSSW